MSDRPDVTHPAKAAEKRPSLRDSIAEPDAFGLVMILILIAVTLIAAAGDHPWVRFTSIAVQACTLLFLMWTVRTSPRVQNVSRALVAIALVLSAFAATIDDLRLEGLISLSIAATFALVAPIVIARRLIQHPVVTFRTILGALCLYLMIGFLFAVLFGIDGLVDPPFFNAPHDGVLVAATPETADPPFDDKRCVVLTPDGVEAPAPTVDCAKSADYMYFSFVTLATLGYGDYTPVGSIGKMLAVTCALFGQLYLVSVVALLVTNIGKARTPRRPRGSPVDPDDVPDP